MCDLYFDMMHASALKSENDVQMKRIKIGKKREIFFVIELWIIPLLLMFICWLEVLYIAWALLGRQNQTIKHERKVFGQDLIIESIHATTQHLSFIIVIIDADKLQLVIIMLIQLEKKELQSFYL